MICTFIEVTEYKCDCVTFNFIENGMVEFATIRILVVMNGMTTMQLQQLNKFKLNDLWKTF